MNGRILSSDQPSIGVTDGDKGFYNVMYSERERSEPVSN